MQFIHDTTTFLSEKIKIMHSPDFADWVANEVLYNTNNSKLPLSFLVECYLLAAPRLDKAVLFEIYPISDQNILVEMNRWLVQQFPGSDVIESEYRYSWHLGNRIYLIFFNPNDAALFKLRWSDQINDTGE